MRTTGLLKKAQFLREPRPGLRVLGPHELHADEDEEITPEERAKVLAQIDEVVASSRLKIDAQTFQFAAQRRGGVLPIVVNLVALLVTVAGVLIALTLSRQAEKTIVTAPVAVLSAEGKMVQALKEASRQELEGKDKEIAAIRDRLAGIDTERQKIRQDADALVQEKQQQLEDTYARAIEQERARLEASGLSAKAVSDQIAAFQAKSKAATDAQLAAFRSQADADRAAKEKAIADLQAQYQASLSQAQSDRTKLQDDAAAKQAALEAGYREKQLSLEKDTAAAQAELTKLRQQQAGEQIVLDQIQSWYQKARDQIQASRPDAAQAVLTDFRAYLDSPDVAALPAVARRRPVDLFLIDSLGELVSAQASQASTVANIQGLVASANLIAAVASVVQTGDDAFQAQSYARARELYLSALAKIPAVQDGYTKLTQMEAMTAEQQKADVAAALTAANAAYRSGSLDAAVNGYRKALGLMQADAAAVDALLSQLTDIGAQRQASADAARISGVEGDAAARAKRAALIEALRSRIAASSPASGPAAAARNTLVALLETKLLVQKTLQAPDVARANPTLYDDLNRYLDALSEQSAADARTQTLRDLDALLGSAAGSQQVPDTILQRYAPADQQALLLSILEKLQTLVK